MLHHGDEGLPEVTRMYGKCRGCVGAYHVLGGRVHGTVATSGALCDIYASMPLCASRGVCGVLECKQLCHGRQVSSCSTRGGWCCRIMQAMAFLLYRLLLVMRIMYMHLSLCG